MTITLTHNNKQITATGSAQELADFVKSLDGSSILEKIVQTTPSTTDTWPFKGVDRKDNLPYESGKWPGVDKAKVWLSDANCFNNSDKPHECLSSSVTEYSASHIDYEKLQKEFDDLLSKSQAALERANTMLDSAESVLAGSEGQH